MKIQSIFFFGVFRGVRRGVGRGVFGKTVLRGVGRGVFGAIVGRGVDLMTVLVGTGVGFVEVIISVFELSESEFSFDSSVLPIVISVLSLVSEFEFSSVSVLVFAVSEFVSVFVLLLPPKPSDS